MGTSQSRNRLIGGANLIRAASDGDTATVRQLLALRRQLGININARSRWRNTALMMAANTEIARAIRSRQRKRPRELHWVVSESKRQKYDIVDGVAAMMNLG